MSDRAGPSPARSAAALPWPVTSCGTSPRNHRHTGPEPRAGYTAPPRSGPACSGRCWPAAARSLRPAGSPPASPSPRRPPSLRLPAIGGLTSTPAGPRFAPSTAPTGCPAECCQSSLECPHRERSCSPGCRAMRIASSACVALLFGRNPQWPLPPVSLPYVSPLHRLRLISACPQSRLDLCQKLFHASLFDGLDRLRIHPGRPAIAAHPPPCFPQNVTPVDPVLQRMETPCPTPLGAHP